jgi:antitoxin (DNA-binding transcriptional repressor) of toxin-antitoxin stability system
MARVNVAEAKARLSELIDAALQGEEIIISRRNKALVKLAVLKQGPSARPGRLAGRIRMAADFDATLEDFAAYMPSAKSRARRKQQR